MRNILASVWRYRFFIFSSAAGEFQSRFSRSRLGGFWGVLGPLCQSAVYALVLSSVLSDRFGGGSHSYAAYLLAGTLGWAFFSEVTLACVNVFTGNANLIKKVSFPGIVLPFSAAVSAGINAVLLLFAVLTVFIISGWPLSVHILWIPAIYAVSLIFAMGFGLILGVLNVFISDIRHGTQILMQLWFWLTPVVYADGMIPERYRHLLKLNPAYPLVSGFQDVLVYGRTPDMAHLAITAALGAVLILFALTLYRKAAGEMADVL